MNANLGGFAAVMLQYPVWVTNTIPAKFEPAELGVIYEWGFIGSYPDWC